MSTPYNGGGSEPNDPLEPNGQNDPAGYEPYPDLPAGSHPENDPYPAYGEANPASPGYQDYPAYGEASTGAFGGYDEYSAFDVNSAAAAAGASALRFHGEQLTDNVPGDGQSPHPINDPESNGYFHTKGTGKVNVFEALGWGFKTTFSNAKLWLVLGLIYLVIAAVLQFVPGFGSMLSSLAMLFFVPWVAAVALQQTLARDVNFNNGKAPAYGKSIGMMVVMGLLWSVLSLVLFTVFGAAAMSEIDLNALPQSPEEMSSMTPEEMFALMRPLLSAMGLTALVSLLFAPFISLQLYYAADNNGSFGFAFAEGFKAGARNYVKLLGLVVLCVLIAVIGAAPFGLGLIIAMPVVQLTLAYAYRQISAGPVPTEA